MPVKVQVTFKDEDAAVLTGIAQNKGIGFATLVRLVVLAWLRLWTKRQGGGK